MPHDMESFQRADESGAGPRVSPSVQRTSLDACTAVISGPPPSVAEIPERDTLITTRWVHSGLHDVMPAIPSHTVATYFGPPAPRTWRCGAARFDAVGRPGATGVIPAGWGGRWDISGESSVSYVFLSASRLQDFADQWLPGGASVELVPCVGEEDPIGSRILRTLARYASRPDPASAMFAEQALDLLCFHLLRNHSSLAKPPMPAPRRGLLTWQVRRVMGHMRDRLDQTLSLDDLAAQVNLSRFHFCTAFRLATGQTPFEALTALRMERARALLSDPRLAVTDIALAVGYRTPSAFSAAFRKATGLTPTEFRRVP